VIGPDDLLEEARELAKTARSREVRRRSAMSRAYYAAFHRADEAARSAGYRFDASEGAGSHVHLLAFLARLPDPGARTAARSLKTLKKQRVLSDYQLAEDISMHMVEQVIEQAEYLLTELLPPPEPA